MEFLFAFLACFLIALRTNKEIFLGLIDVENILTSDLRAKQQIFVSCHFSVELKLLELLEAVFADDILDLVMSRFYFAPILRALQFVIFVLLFYQRFVVLLKALGAESVAATSQHFDLSLAERVFAVANTTFKRLLLLDLSFFNVWFTIIKLNFLDFYLVFHFFLI